MTELNRMSSHLLFLATNGMDIGAVSMMLYGWREREEVLRFFQKVTGLRMNHNFIRPGGVAADLPDGWRDDVLRLLDLIPPRLDEYDVADDRPADLARAAAGRRRHHRRRRRMALGATGPILRSTGYAWDLRRDMPYLAYDQVDFDVDRRHLRRLLRPLRHPAQRDPRVDADRAPDPRQDARRATTASRTRRSRRRRGPASTSRWRR